MTWVSASKQDVQNAVEADWIGIDSDIKMQLSRYLVDPQPATIERFGEKERAFVVARIGDHVVFFDDIEQDFGTAIEFEGMLSNPAAYGNIAVALRELEREAGIGR